MTLFLENKCNSIVLINFNIKVDIILHPHETKSIVITDCDTLNLTIRKNAKSNQKNGIFNIILETEYILSNLSENTKIIITREKIRFAQNASYERLFIHSSGAKIISEMSKVFDKNRLKQKFKLYDKIDSLSSVIYADFFFVIVAIIVGFIIAFKFSFKIFLIYLICLFLFISFVACIAHILVNFLFIKFAKFDTKKIFYQYLENEYISNYYSGHSRTPFMGKIDTN
jgi:cytochrome b subunit of formate dehydrogenase